MRNDVDSNTEEVATSNTDREDKTSFVLHADLH
eukprot:CAMPEP_0185788346 /NCGR_PEP_ID=MMETSP1174-20130828/145667_1 /TAXON_ID=35687 /ORGANISM="Dictyocha speculum, Strain CCMP1381" /LENGTH=32 /DNA_ID= /DNA_START= /DNA_END= /DNA_ORIENTATION=